MARSSLSRYGRKSAGRSGKARKTDLKTTDGDVIYDLDPDSAELWAVAGPDGHDARKIDPDDLPPGFRWVSESEYERAEQVQRDQVKHLRRKFLARIKALQGRKSACCDRSLLDGRRGKKGRKGVPRKGRKEAVPPGTQSTHGGKPVVKDPSGEWVSANKQPPKQPQAPAPQQQAPATAPAPVPQQQAPAPASSGGQQSYQQQQSQQTQQTQPATLHRMRDMGGIGGMRRYDLSPNVRQRVGSTERTLEESVEDAQGSRPRDYYQRVGSTERTLEESAEAARKPAVGATFQGRDQAGQGGVQKREDPNQTPVVYHHSSHVPIGGLRQRSDGARTSRPGITRRLLGLLGLHSIDGRKRRPARTGRTGKKAAPRKGRKGADSPVGTRSTWGGRPMLKVRPGADGWEPDPSAGGGGRPPALRHTQPRNPGLLRRSVEAVLGRGEQAKWQDLEHALQGIGGSVEPTRQPGVFAVHTDDPMHRDQAVWTLKQHGVPGEAISVHGGQTFIDFNKFKALTDAARYKDIEALAHCVKSLFPYSHTGLADTLEQAGATTLARYCRQGWGEATEIAEAALAADPRRLPEPLRREFAGLIGRK